MYELLIQLLVATALVDKSTPPCWRTNEVLGAIERLVLVTRNQCAEFAKIASASLDKLGEQVCPEVRVLIKLAVLNGRRRDDTEDTASVQRLFDDVKDDISKLEEGPRKTRCHTFFLYQQKVFGTRCGFYAEVSKAAEAEAALNVKPEEKAISMYLARVYAMWAALMTGVQAEIDSAFTALKVELPLLQQGVAGTALEVQWGKGNGPIHLLQAMILANIHDKTLFDTNMAIVLEATDKLGDAFNPGISVLKGGQSLQDNDPSGVVGAYSSVFSNPACSLADKAWANLILARLGDVDDVALVYARITPVPDAHMVAAVAARELALLDNMRKTAVTDDGSKL